MEIQMHSDNAIQTFSEDLLGRQPIVKMIADAIIAKTRNNHECYTIGIYGKWGEGKTSVLNMLKTHLLAHEGDNILISTFNPWILKNEEAMLIEFFNVLVKESIFKKSVAKIKEYVAAISLGAGTISNMIVPTSGKTTVEVTKRIIDVLPSFQQTIQERKDDISKTITKSKKHLLVLIDDVDRLDNAETHALLKLVRQVADFENVIYVIAMDADIVSKSVSQYFGAGTYDDGRRFLDKIVQIPIVLPQIENHKLRHILTYKLSELFASISSSISETTVQNIVDNISDLFSSIREINRYINQLSFVLPTLYNEVDIIDLCMLEAVKLFTPQGYHLIYEHKHIIIRKPISTATISVSIETLQNENDDKINSLIQKIVNNISNNTRSAFENILKQRLLHIPPILIRHRNIVDNKKLYNYIYFDKYFMQCVPYNIISDTILDGHLTGIKNNDINWIIKTFNELFDKYSLDEIKRAAVYCINHSSNNPEIRSQISAKVCKAMSQMEINKITTYRLYNSTDLDNYIANEIIPSYMLLHNDDHSRQYDENNIADVCKYIVEKSFIRFSMLFFYQVYQIKFKAYTNILCDLFDILHNRLLSEFNDMEIFQYDKDIQCAYFSIWKYKDKTQFLDFIKTKIQDPNFPIIEFICQHIKKTTDGSDYLAFNRLFECSNLIVYRLKKLGLTDDDLSKPAIEVFCANNRELMQR